MNPKEFARAWPGTLRKIEFVPPKPVLPYWTTIFPYDAGLRQTFSISNNELTITILEPAEQLSKTWNEQVRDWSMPHDWARSWRIGDITYTQASAWLCIEEVSGRVFAIDVEIDGPVYLINESLLNLALSMYHWARWFSDTGGCIGSVNKLRSTFAKDTAFKPGEIDAYWGPYITNISESNADAITVTHA